MDGHYQPGRLHSVEVYLQIVKATALVLRVASTKLTATGQIIYLQITCRIWTLWYSLYSC